MTKRGADSRTGFWDFLRAFGAGWLTRMSGPLTVPLAIGALLFPRTLQGAVCCAGRNIGRSCFLWGMAQRARARRTFRKGQDRCSRKKGWKRSSNNIASLNDEQKAAVKRVLAAGRVTPSQSVKLSAGCRALPRCRRRFAFDRGKNNSRKKRFYWLLRDYAGTERCPYDLSV